MRHDIHTYRYVIWIGILCLGEFQLLKHNLKIVYLDSIREKVYN